MASSNINPTENPESSSGNSGVVGAANLPETDKSGRRWPWIILSLVALGFVLYLLSVTEDTVDVSETAEPPPLQLVSIENVVVGAQTVEVRVFGEVRPRWSAELTSAVSGRVTKVFANALAGEPVETGSPLVEIENSRFIAELAAAELALKEAELTLWQAENAALLARREFERNRQKPPNDLALKLPQLEIAKSSVASAVARISAARRQLEDTTIVAPFSAFVTERFVSPGQSVSVGDRLLKLADKSKFELVAELSRNNWKLASKPLAGKSAAVLNQDGKKIARAKIRRGGGFLDETTRQHKVFLEIENPATDDVLSGDFVTILLPGVTVPAALDLPESALTQEGYVWHLDAEDRLRRLEPTVLYRRQDRVIVEAPQDKQQWRIAVTPLVSFLPGQKVQARIAEN